MSEYWVSRKKYFCKYCNIYIADDAPSRQQHENGLRHKGNKERFVRNLYKAGEKKKNDLEEEKREMVRVERAAHAAFSQDIGAGHASASTSSSGQSMSVAAKKLPVGPTNPFANYSTAASLGYTDPDAERLAFEAERRLKEGVAGNWELVLPSSAAAPPPPDPTAVNAEPNLKRGNESTVDEQDTRQFKLRKKTLNVGLGEIYDPGIIPIKLKKEEAAPGSKPESSAQLTVETTQPGTPLPTEKPKWAKVQWRRPGDLALEGNEKNGTRDSGQEVHVVNGDMSNRITEDQEGGADGVDSQSVKAELLIKTEQEETSKTENNDTVLPPPEPATSLFRKRKIPAGASRGRP